MAHAPTPNSDVTHRLRPAMANRLVLERLTYDGNYGSKLWRAIDTIQDHEWAHDRLAVCEGRMTAEECARRVVQRKKARRNKP